MATPSKNKNTKAEAAPENNKAMTAPPPSQELAEREDDEATFDAEDYGTDAGKGHENQDMDDRKIPMLVILQPGTPIVTKGDAKAGQIINSVTGEVYDAVDFVPSGTDHVFTEWKPLDEKGQGGGFRGRHPKNAKIVRDAINANGGKFIGKIPLKHLDPAGKPLLDRDNKLVPDTELVETYEVPGIVFQAWKREGDKLVPVFGGKNAEGPVLISFTSTKIKAYREWNTNVSLYQSKVKDVATGKITKAPVPMFAHRVRMTTVFRQEGKLSWYVPDLSPVFSEKNGRSGMDRSLLGLDDERYIAAKVLHEQFMKGAKSGAYETTQADDPQSTGAPTSEAASAF